MNFFVTSYGNEFFRMVRRKKVAAGMMISALIPLGIVLAKTLSLGWSVELIYREDLIRLSLSLFTPLLLPLFAVVLVADAFLDEQSKGSLRTAVLLPDSRNGHFWAKIGSAFTGTAAMVFTLWLFSLLSGFALASRGGWLPALGIGLLQCLASLLPIIMVLEFSALATQFLKSGGAMVLSLIGLTLAMQLLPIWLGDLNRILPAAWLGFGASIAYLPFSRVAYALAVMLLWAVFTGGLAMYRFERKMI